MEESEKENLFATFEAVINSIIEEKRRDPKNRGELNRFQIRVNFGLQITQDFYFWVNLIADRGKYTLARGKLDNNYDLVLKAAPEDLLFFCNGENSVVHMVRKKNRFGDKKLRFSKGDTGRNLGKLLKLSKILVLEEIKRAGTAKAAKPVKLKQKKLTHIKKNYKLFFAFLIGVFSPMLLTALFMESLGRFGALWAQADENFGLMFSMIQFNTFNILYDIPLLGKGYWIVFIAWAFPGLFIGLISRDFLKSLLIAGAAFLVNVILYWIFVSMYSADFPPGFVDSLIKNPDLTSGGPAMPLALLLQSVIESFVLPILVLFTLVGGLINPKPEIYTIFDSKKNIKIKQKFRPSPIVPKKRKGPSTYTDQTSLRREVPQQETP